MAEGRLENLLVTVDGDAGADRATPTQNGAAGDDEDGVAFLGNLNRFTTSTPLIVTASGPGLLDAWVGLQPQPEVRRDGTDLRQRAGVGRPEPFVGRDAVVGHGGHDVRALPLQFVRPSVAGGFWRWAARSKTTW